MIFPESPNVRSTDPLASHLAADTAVRRVPTKLAIERCLEAAGRPLTADEIWTRLRYNHGYYCSHERVRTVLNEGSGKSRRESVRFHAFERVEGQLGTSDMGNAASLWRLRDA